MRDPSSWIGTYSGTRFWPLDPRAGEITIEDIAHSLARQCRFNGHCSRFYSVAEHSVEVSRLTPPCYALWGLLHDAAEAYLSDIVRPLKARSVFAIGAGVDDILTYHEAEARLLVCVADRFGLKPQFVPDAVALVDDRMLMTEREQLFAGNQPEWTLRGVEPYSITLHAYRPEDAEAMFLARFEELTHERQRGAAETRRKESL